MMHLKIAQNKLCIFLCKFCTFPVTEGNKIWHIYSSSRPQQESSPTTQNLNISGYAERHEFWEHHKIHFGPVNFGPGNPQNLQNPTQKDRNFEKMHSLTSAKMPTNKESIHFSRILHFSHHDSNALINPIQHQPTNHFLGTPSNTFF